MKHGTRWIALSMLVIAYGRSASPQVRTPVRAPTITALPIGTFHRWLESKGKLGGQHKCTRCANHREIVDAVLLAAHLP